MKRSSLTIALLSISGLLWSQTNIIDTSSWSVGNGNVTGFYKFGTDAENVREVGVGPHGDSEVLWRAVPDAGNDADGGWDTSYHVIDPSKDYRFSVWIKKTNSNDGSSLFGLHAFDVNESATSRQLDGTSIVSPYFYWGDLPQLDSWYLLVGYVYGHAHTGQTNQGGIYDTNGVKVAGLTDFKMSTNTNWLVHRTYLYQDTNTQDSQFFSKPTLYEVNGQEPSISDLINPGGSGGGGSIWAANGDDINYSGGNVGIGTTSPDETLTVKGKIHAEEVRIDLSVPAPDYVFNDTYELKSLEEVRKYIKKHGHLPNIPEAAEMEAEGIELGEMNMKLLEKIEELTLYILQLEERLKKIEKAKK